MNKISLLSLLTVLTISTGAKANVENPLYMPKEGVGYSKTGFTMIDSDWIVSEKIGYGFSNNFAGSIGFDYRNMDAGDSGLGVFELDLEYRMSSGNFITDLYFGMATAIDDKVIGGDYTTYEAGLRFGKMKKDWTLAANVGYEHEDLGADTASNIIIGADVVHEFNNAWSAQMGAEYKMLDDHYVGQDDPLALTLQANYENAGLWSLFYTTDVMDDTGEDAYGLKYGVQF